MLRLDDKITCVGGKGDVLFFAVSIPFRPLPWGLWI